MPLAHSLGPGRTGGVRTILLPLCGCRHPPGLRSGFDAGDARLPHWKDTPRDGDFDRRQRELAERVGTSCVRDFLFHTAHLYQTLTRCAKARDGAKGRAAEQVARRDFAALCSHQELLRVLAAAQGDLETP